MDSRTRGSLGLVFDDGTTANIRIALDVPGRNEFRLRVLGSQASAELLATEEDPTATPIRWQGAEPPRVTTGATGSPLLVPYLHEALAGRAASIADVAAAHALTFSGEVLTQARLARSSMA